MRSDAREKVRLMSQEDKLKMLTLYKERPTTQVSAVCDHAIPMRLRQRQIQSHYVDSMQFALLCMSFTCMFECGCCLGGWARAALLTL